MGVTRSRADACAATADDRRPAAGSVDSDAVCRRRWTSLDAGGGVLLCGKRAGKTRWPRSPSPDGSCAARSAERGGAPSEDEPELQDVTPPRFEPASVTAGETTCGYSGRLSQVRGSGAQAEGGPADPLVQRAASSRPELQLSVERGGADSGCLGWHLCKGSW